MTATLDRYADAVENRRRRAGGGTIVRMARRRGPMLTARAWRIAGLAVATFAAGVAWGQLVHLLGAGR